MIDLADYYSGGYFLIRADNPGWEQLKTDLLPDKLLSLSRCICPFRLGVWWGLHQGDRETALRFGILETKIDEFNRWCHEALGVEIELTGMFLTPEAARRFVERFVPNTEGLYLIGTGLYNQLEQTNWREYYIENIFGTEKRIEQHQAIADGIPLGFEVVSFPFNDFGHSWICSYLYEDMFQLFGIRPGQFGLLQTREDAQKVYEWIEEDKQQGRRAEPEPYDYWLLVSYPLQSQG